MANGPPRQCNSGSSKGHSASQLPSLALLNDLLSAGRVRELTKNYQDTPRNLTDKASRVRALLMLGMGHYELGNVSDSLAVLREAYEEATAERLDLQFQVALALFSRESQFQTPEETLPALSRLRQLASSLGERISVGGIALRRCSSGGTSRSLHRRSATCRDRSTRSAELHEQHCTS